MFKLLVCGSREIRDKKFVFDYLDYLLSTKDLKDVVIMHGGQKSVDKDTKEEYGADYFADCWAVERGVRKWVYPADWDQHGRAAGPIRNARMASDNPDGCVAFLSTTAKNRGTKDMLSKCKKIGVVVKECYI